MYLIFYILKIIRVYVYKYKYWSSEIWSIYVNSDLWWHFIHLQLDGFVNLGDGGKGVMKDSVLSFDDRATFIRWCESSLDHPFPKYRMMTSDMESATRSEEFCV